MLRSYATLAALAVQRLDSAAAGDDDACFAVCFMLVVSCAPGQPQSLLSMITLFCTAFTVQRYANAVYAVVMCLCVRLCVCLCVSSVLFVTRWCCVKMAKHRITQTTLRDGPESLGL